MRNRLHNRRPGARDCFFWPPTDGRRIHTTAGFDAAWSIKETFLCGSGMRTGSDGANLLADISVLISLLLQHGASLDQIAHSLGRDEADKPASMVGAAVDTLKRIQTEEAPDGAS